MYVLNTDPRSYNANITETLAVIDSKFSTMADAIVGQSSTSVEDLVHREVQNALAETNKSIAELLELLLSPKQNFYCSFDHGCITPSLEE